MAKLESLGIKRLEGIHYYVHDLDRSRKFYCGKLDFGETWRSSPDLEKTGGQKSACFSAGHINVVCSSPLAGHSPSSSTSGPTSNSGGRASRFLGKHPDGVGTLIFAVEDAEKTFRLLEQRGGTPIDDIQTFTDD